MTGSVLFAARAPARCAALPAAAIMTPKPFSRAPSANALASSGVRWALMTRASTGMESSRSCLTHFSTTGQSLSLPMMTAAFFFIMVSPPKKYVKATARAAVTLQ